MKQKVKINNLQNLFNLIEINRQCSVTENEKDFFYIAAPFNSDVFVNIGKNEGICDIILRTIERLEEFDADERFTEWWSTDFAKHNGFSPSQFIGMLKEDEKTFRNLADKLRKLQYYDKII